MNEELREPLKATRDFTYLTKEQAISLSSMEGDLEWAQHLEQELKVSDTGKYEKKLYKYFSYLATVIPGIALAFLFVIISKYLSVWVGNILFSFEIAVFSPIVFTILIGIAFRNIIGVPNQYVVGLKFCVRHILRMGIALLGLGVSLSIVAQIGLDGLPVIIICILGGFCTMLALSRFINIPSRLGTLIAVGTCICGVSAVVATSQCIKAKDDEISYAVICVTIYGLLGLIFYPFFAHWLFHGDTDAIGIFLGTAIHDTSQVVGAGLIYSEYYFSEETLNIATITKLLRNLFLVIIIPLIAIFYSRFKNADRSCAKGPRWFQMIPIFVVAFICLAIVRSVGDIGEKPFFVLDPETWVKFLNNVKTISFYCITLAMASLGLSTNIGKIKDLGVTPICVGLVISLAISLLSYLGIHFIVS